jgi:hypothetical protein
MTIMQRLMQISKLAASVVRGILRGFAEGGSQYAARQTEVYLMRHTEKGYEYIQRQETGC